MTVRHPFDWRVLKSRYAIQTQWIKLREDTCQMPSGVVLEPYYILEYPDYINVVALTPDRQVVLVREYRHGAGMTILELPSGRVDDGESPEDAARRELLEETGYASQQWIHLCTLSPNPDNHTNRVHSFLALDAARADSPAPEEEEQIEVNLLPLEQVAQMLYGNQFLQAMHASALFYALRRLEENDPPRP